MDKKNAMAEKIKNGKLTEKEYWEKSYVFKNNPKENNSGYEVKCLRFLLDREIQNKKPKNILEIGAGNSAFLPYIAKKYDIKIAGIDYSKNGCDLLKNRLDREKIKGKVFYMNVFDEKAVSETGTYDIVYSLGVVEHFSDIESVIKQLLKFVKKDGLLITEVPNMPSFHSLLSNFLQPDVLKKHNLKTRDELVYIYNKLGLQEIRDGFLGFFSLDMITWGRGSKFPRLERIMLPLIFIIVKTTSFVLKLTNKYESKNKFFSPFYYSIGKKT
jgi:2-polyprenyl-3-methyl-5-hydroxy-6-metoxy-1,4-benzoquinol methylase